MADLRNRIRKLEQARPEQVILVKWLEPDGSMVEPEDRNRRLEWSQAKEDAAIAAGKDLTIIQINWTAEPEVEY